MTMKLTDKLKSSVSKYAQMITSLAHPTSEMQQLKAKERAEKTRKARLAAYKSRVKRYGHAYKDPARPANIPPHGKCTFRAPDIIRDDVKGEVVMHMINGKEKPVLVRRAMPRAVAKKMLYNDNRALQGRWCN